MIPQNLLLFLFLFIGSIISAQDGALDLSFGEDGKVVVDFSNGNDRVFDIAIQADGKIIVAGSSQGKFALARFHPNGDIDESFDMDGKISVDTNGINSSNLLALQADGKILVSGYTLINTPNIDFILIRFNSDGSLDDSFGNGGILITDLRGNPDYGTDVIVLENGKILQTGNTDINPSLTGFALVQYLSDGSLDSSFGIDGKVETGFPGGNIEGALGLAIQDDQKIVAVGWSLVSHPGGTERDIAIARYLPNGSLDLSFGDDGTLIIPNLSFSQLSRSVGFQSDGKILLESGIKEGVGAFGMIRLMEDGKLDDTFGDGGMIITEVGNGSFSYKIYVQADQKIILLGSAKDQNDKSNFALIRYLPDGSLDNTFGLDGKTGAEFSGISFAHAIAVQEDGKIVLAGSANNGINNDFAVARFLNDFTNNTQDPVLIKKMALTISPNPITSSSILNYTLPHSAKVQINLYNQTGQWVQNILAPTTQVAGPQQQIVHFHKDLAPGVYHVVIDDQEQKYSLQVVKIKE